MRAACAGYVRGRTPKEGLALLPGRDVQSRRENQVGPRECNRRPRGDRLSVVPGRSHGTGYSPPQLLVHEEESLWT